MKKVIQKGIAGLGNRFQVLGYCFDIAQLHKAKLLVDWRDSSWRDDFSNYFDSDTISDFQDDDYPNVMPEWWADKINAPCAKRLAGEDFKRVDVHAIASQWETLAVCQYKAQYSSEIFNHISFKKRISDKAKKFKLYYKKYNCWHIRATDKTAGDPFEIVNKIMTKSRKIPSVILTDNLQVKNYAVFQGFFCPSIIPDIPMAGGIHHSTETHLSKSKITRQELNDSALADILIGANATNFHSTCENSSFSQLIERIRSIK